VYSYNTISHAASECVRYAIVHSPTGPSPATAAQIQSATYADLPAPNQLKSSNVTVTWPADPGLPSEQDAQCTVALNYTLRIPFLPPKTLPTTATARMLVSQ
jgi:hypothetical protein